jgi:hypothetical protein
VRVPSWANSVVVIGVRIHALLADKAKANFVSGVGKREFAAGAKPQKACGEEINDFLVRVPWLIGGRRKGERFEFVHGKRSYGKRLSC